MQYCSLQNQILFSPADKFTAEHHSFFGPTSLFFLKLLFYSSSVLYWASTDIGGGGLIFWCHIFWYFHIIHGVFMARILKWFIIPFSNAPCFVRSLHHHTLVTKMEEQKDVLSSSPVRTPKSQLATEQPSTGGCWNPPKKKKDFLISKNKGKATVSW